MSQNFPRAAVCVIISAVAVLMFSVNPPISAEMTSNAIRSDSPAGTFVDLKKLGLSFVPNEGQFPTEVGYVAQGVEYDLFFSAENILFNLISRKPAPSAGEGGEAVLPGRRSNVREEITSETVEIRFLDALSTARIAGENLKPGTFNYLKGEDRSRWKTNLSTFGRIRYSGLYKGIDLIFYGTQGRVQYDFVLQPYADASRIRLAITGTASGKVDQTGDLRISTGTGEITLSRPVSYQTDQSGNRRSVESEFAVEDGGRTVTFRLGNYDRSRELIIDPVLTYSTLLGGTQEDIGQAVKTDPQGNAYITGSTRSLNFPITRGGSKPVADGTDIFITKLNPDGDEIIYSTVVGGNGNDVGHDIDVDVSGNAYVVGEGGWFPSVQPAQVFLVPPQDGDGR